MPYKLHFRERIQQFSSGLTELSGYHHHMTCSYHPQGNGKNLTQYLKFSQKVLHKCHEILLILYLFDIFLGMVERCNHTIEDIIKKSMQSQSDWCPALPLVLYAIITSQHASTGFTPFCMLYNYDPILPFEYADELEHGILSDGKSDGDLGFDGEVSGTTRSDLLLTKIQNMEDQWKNIFNKASKSIKKHRNIKPNVTTTGKQRVNHLKLVINASNAINEMSHIKPS